jgi:tripartite motif-containing protein 71
MKRVWTIAIFAALAAAAWGVWKYEGGWGESGSGPGSFNGPGFVAVAPNGNVYVADQNNDRVQYFTPTGSFLGSWGTAGSGDGEFECPCGIAITPGGTVYVTENEGTETSGHRVQYFSLTGVFKGKWGKRGSRDGEFREPAGVDYDSQGNVYVVEWGNHRVQYFTSIGSFLGKWGELGSGVGEFNNPIDVNVSPNGYVYVCDHRNHRVQYFTKAGSIAGSFPVQGFPTGAAIAANGDVYVAMFDYCCIRIYSSTGTPKYSFGRQGSGPGEFDAPIGVAFSPTGARCYVTEYNGDCVEYWNRNEPAVVPSSLGKVKALFR